MLLLPIRALKVASGPCRSGLLQAGPDHWAMPQLAVPLDAATVDSATMDFATLGLNRPFSNNAVKEAHRRETVKKKEHGTAHVPNRGNGFRLRSGQRRLESLRRFGSQGTANSAYGQPPSDGGPRAFGYVALRSVPGRLGAA